MTIWKLLTGNAIFLKRVNPSGHLKHGYIIYDDKQIIVKTLFSRKKFSLNDVSFVRARIYVSPGLEEFYELELGLNDDHTLILDSTNKDHVELGNKFVNRDNNDLDHLLTTLANVKEWTYFFEMSRSHLHS